MKTLKITLAVVALGGTFIACNEGKKDMAHAQIETYEAYIDSVSDVATDKAAENWDAIERKHHELEKEAKHAIASVEADAELERILDESTLKYEAYEAEVLSIYETKALRQSLLGANYTEKDMSFNWINKDNILDVYETFVTTVENNKDSYSREDWDEIKLIYEAIDTRKNTVEKEGLTTEDNNDIAALKLKFAPMYQLNRMGAKSDENAAAKK
ncbi:hypothetical protein [Tamlana sp. I1]|uniref:hypothetical protein n=1 Tax=Tamlana sp. I1 TaxID=2762061 RepID=UPI00188E0262|nr:hypothetical protein [Tamlana sp. I1]